MTTGYGIPPARDGAAVVATVLASVFALVIGGAIGIVTTFTHGQYAPWGLIVGLAITAALLTGFRLVFQSRTIAAAAGIGMLAAASALALPADAGVVLSFQGADAVAGPVWAIGCVVIAVAVVAWPSRARASE